MTTAVLDSLLTQNVTLVERTSDAYGSVIDGDSHSLRGFVQYSQERVMSREGIEVTANAIAFLPAEAPVELGAGASYQVEHEGRRLDVVSIERIDDPRLNTTRHFELGCI